MTGSDTTGVRRRRVLQAVAGASVVGVAGCLNTTGGSGGRPLFSHTIWGMFGSWEDAYVSGGRFYAQDHDYIFENHNSQMGESAQVRHINQFIQEGVDGIAIGPVSATATVDAIESASEEGIPVIACNSDIETDALDLSVYVGNRPACKTLGEELVDAIGGSGVVIDLQGDLATSNGKQREAGFREAVDPIDDIEVIEARADFQASPAQEKTFSRLQSRGVASDDGEIEAIFAANGGMALGASNALEQFGASPGDVFMACMDGSPTVIDLIDQGWLNRGFAQPTQFYLPIALRYLDTVRTEGEDALPSPGDELTTDDFEITGEQHLGTDIWADQSWAPATVQERFDHPYLQTNGKLLTPDNYDADSNWGVIFGEPSA